MFLTEYDEAKTLAEERADGIEDYQIKVAHKMLSEGVPVETVIHFTGISKENIEKIINGQYNTFLAEYDESKKLSEERYDVFNDENHTGHDMGYKSERDAGHNEGVMENQISTARNMLTREFSDETIIFCTGISSENLENIKNEIKSE